MKRGCFVTGTDTGVGKTLAACALIHALAQRGVHAFPMKPVAAGAEAGEGAPANADTMALAAAAGLGPVSYAEVTPCLLREPMAPHIAAQREGRRIERAALLRAFAARDHGFTVVEGVGGFLVPLADDFDAADLARDIGLPVVLVVGLRLGCLNHALLTERAVAATGLPLAGWIANRIDPAMAAADENIEALRARLQPPLLGILPHSPDPDAARLARHLDPAPLLA
jgi:dethiobiotin synthetase